MRLAWPIMLTSLNWTLMHIIDVAVVGHYGTDELAALAASRTLTFIAIVMGFSGLSGVLVYASRADGGGRLAETGDIFRSGLALGLAIGLAAALVLRLWAFELLASVGVEPALQRPGAAVVEAMALAFPAQLLLAASSYFLEGISRPRRVMTVNLLMLPLNAVLAWAWVGGHLGLPALGAVGAAYATATISWLGAAAMIALIWALPRARERRVRDFGRAALRRALAGVPPLAWFGLMPAIGASLELAGFAWLMVLSTQLGNAAAGAFQAMLSVHNVAFALSMGFGSAAGVRVGNAVGAGLREEAWPRALIAGALAALLLGLLSLALVLRGPRPGLALFGRPRGGRARRLDAGGDGRLPDLRRAPICVRRRFALARRAGLGERQRHYRLLRRHRRPRLALGPQRLGRGRARLCRRRRHAGLRRAPVRPLRPGAQEIGPKLKLSVRPPRGMPRSALSNVTRPRGPSSRTGGAIDH